MGSQPAAANLIDMTTTTTRSLPMDDDSKNPRVQPQVGADALAAMPAGEAREDLLSKLVSQVYGESDVKLRAGLLECLLRPVGPLGLVAVAAGAFGGYLRRDPWSRISVPLEDALRYSSDQVYDLARYVDQVQPEVFSQVATLMADNPACLATISGSLLLVALRAWFPRATGGRR